jgi:two-component system sensor histidine kinase KdpD
MRLAMLTTREWRTMSFRLLAGAGAVACVTWVAFQLHLNLSTATSLHLLLVILIALRWGFWEASIASILSVLCLDYFFTAPLFALYMSDSSDWIALTTFETVALLVSRLSNHTRRHAADAEVQRKRMEQLYGLSQSVLLLDHQRPVGAQMCVLVQQALAFDCVAIWDAAAEEGHSSGCDVRLSQEVRRFYDCHLDGGDFEEGSSSRLLRTGERAIGAILAKGHAIDPRSMDAAASLAALAIERARSFSSETAAEAARQTEQLRSAVLDGLAHAFKTPLTTILASSSGILEMGTVGFTEQKLLRLIESEADHLNGLTARLLTTARLDSAHIRLAKRRTNLVELLTSALASFRAKTSFANIEFNAPTDSLDAIVDVGMMTMAVNHLLDNAVKYSEPESYIAVSLLPRGDAVVISVKNTGSYIPKEQRDRIFERFYRSPHTALRVAGTGIGLSVAKRVVEAHRGRIVVDSHEDDGTEFSILLPCRTAMPSLKILVSAGSGAPK